MNPELNPELCISPICSAQVLTTSEFPVDSIVVRLFLQLLIPNSIPQYCKSLPRNSTSSRKIRQIRPCQKIRCRRGTLKSYFNISGTSNCALFFNSTTRVWPTVHVRRPRARRPRARAPAVARGRGARGASGALNTPCATTH